MVDSIVATLCLLLVCCCIDSWQTAAFQIGQALSGCSARAFSVVASSNYWCSCNDEAETASRLTYTMPKRRVTRRMLNTIHMSGHAAPSVGKEDEQQQQRIRNAWSVAAAQHADDVKTSLQNTNLVSESLREEAPTLIPFEWCCQPAQYGNSNHGRGTTVPAVLETLEPVLDEHARRDILKAALQYWDNQKQEKSFLNKGNSRFTLQGPNKRELHVSDLNEAALRYVNAALEHSIYPLIRHAFGNDILGEQHKHEYSQLLYDALVIEYDATSLHSTIKSSPTASQQQQLLMDTCFPAQPLHRDLGLISVNVALNDPSEFTGGGTVFERLLNDEIGDGTTQQQPQHAPIDIALLPRAAGHALMHPSRERHAGGALTSGRRTIMVFFVTATATGGVAEAASSCPKLEIASRCKTLGMSLAKSEKVTASALLLSGMEDRIACYRAAICADETDGEAWLYLAMTLMEKGPTVDDKQKTSIYSEAVNCLYRSRLLNPADGRVYNTLGLALVELEKAAQARLSQQIDDAYCTAALLHQRAALAGCKGAAAEARGALLNWGLWHANRNEFAKALSVLARVCVDGPVAAITVPNDNEIQNMNDPRTAQDYRVIRDANNLLSFCAKQIQAAEVA